MIDHDDEGYDLFLAECVAECSCCDSCSLRPCPGVTAGGICDRFCVCRSDDDYPADDEDG